MKSRLVLSITFFIILTFNQSHTLEYERLKITVLGTGYVGLVTGACLAEFGHNVICADIIEEKISLLRQGIIPIYESGLEEIVHKNTDKQKLIFTTDISYAIQESDIIFIAVGTPMSDSGQADLSAIQGVIENIAQNLNRYKTIITKSTVPIGTGYWIHNMLCNDYAVDTNLFSIVSNPEFLREGCAVNDFLHPDRLVIGTNSEYAREIMMKVYAPLIENQIPCVFTDVVTAETIKYTCNAYLATKISFINEIANLCDQTGADITTIAYAMGLDHRINSQFLQPGPGFGGSCFPKDTQALLYTARSNQVQIKTVQAAVEANKHQKQQAIKKLLRLLNNNIEGKTVAVLGLAFKANTDDIRYSPAIDTIQALLNLGAHIRAYDPAAMHNMRTLFPSITYCNTIDDTVHNTNALMIMTEWEEFRTMDLMHISNLMKEKVIVDTRNILNIDQLHALGFTFDTIGRSGLCVAKPSKRYPIYWYT